LATVVRDEDTVGGDGSGSGVSESQTLQQRFENSDFGKATISCLVAGIVAVGVVWNLPSSPISDRLHEVVAPIAVTAGLDQTWAVYAPPDTRLVSVEVHVRMANGETRVWNMQPGAPGVGWWARWEGLKRSAILDATVRPQLAHWVVRQVTTSGERAVDVTVLLRSENLSKPGEDAGGKSPAMKVLYRETLAAPQ
jgi:hypothetical protein